MNQGTLPIDSEQAGAIFSIDDVYRYRLWRTWEPERGRLLWIMLNPSTATATVLDPTIRKCIGFAKRWGYGSIEVVNLFAFRATDPKVMRRYKGDPIGPENNARILAAASEASAIVCAWGNNGAYRFRDRAVVDMLRADDKALYCLKRNVITRSPVHPLYVPYEQRLQEFAG